jgi:hypothetical protein
MTKNMGIADKIIRIIIALTFLALYFTGIVTGIFGIILIVLAVVFILTSLISFCPLYILLGISTCPAKNK